MRHDLFLQGIEGEGFENTEMTDIQKLIESHAD